MNTLKYITYRYLLHPALTYILLSLFWTYATGMLVRSHQWIGLVVSLPIMFYHYVAFVLHLSGIFPNKQNMTQLEYNKWFWFRKTK